MPDTPSFKDMLASARAGQSARKAEREELPRVGRKFRASYDSDCASMIAGKNCNGEIFEGEDIAYVDDEIACEACVDHAQEIRDAYFDR